MSVDEVRNYLFVIATEFKTIDIDELAIIDTLINQAMLTHNQSTLGSSYLEAVSYFVAHQLTTSGFKPADSVSSGSSSTTQEVLKKKAGNLEITYSSNTVKKTQVITSGIESSKYGSMYQEIMNRSLITPRWL